MDQTPVQPGSEVVLRFSLTLEDGTVMEGTGDGEPLCLVIGDGTLVASLEQVILGMTAGQHKRVRLAPEDAFGYASPQNIHTMERRDFPNDLDVAAGKVIGFTTPAGDEVAGTVLGVDDDNVQVDFNHPLAGYVLDFEVEVLAVRS